ncbi:MAG: hypothetical protein Q8Q42_04015 [Nanoarchaeota archaeon]|nr:hypothetical protein [Nanoarchaeota archaeon]
MKIGDRTLIITGLLTLLITLGSVTIILMKIDGVAGITGFATSNASIGFVNVTILPSVALTLVVDHVNFSSGTIDSVGTAINTSDGDNNGDNPGGFDNPGPFRLRNDGNVYVNVTLNGSTPAIFFGGIAATSDLNYSFATKNISSNELFNDTCGNYDTGAGIDYFHYANSSDTQPFGITMNPNHQMVCPNMSYVTATDEFNVSIFLNITTAVAPDANYTDVVEFFVTSLGHS